MEFKARILDDKAIERTITRLAHEIIEKNKGVENIALVGIHTRGLPLAKLIAARIREIEEVDVRVGSIDITPYRDDLSAVEKENRQGETSIDFEVNGLDIILVDDVIYTGRTVRAALDAIMDLGRPRTIQLAALVDRGHRELPIRADYVGKNVPTSNTEIVKVRLAGLDGLSEVSIYKR